MAGTLFVVATPIGNLEDMSARAIRVLRAVAVIAAEDTRRTAHLLQRFGLTTRTISFHEHSEKGKTSDLIARLQAGDDVALVSDAGTPTVSDPGEHLVRAALVAGIRVEPVPGPSAVVTALSVAGMGADGFVFLGFAPRKGSERRAWMDRLAGTAAIVPVAVFYEAPHRIRETLDELQARFGGLEVVVCRELTKAHEQIVRGRLGELAPFEARGEFTVVVDFGQTTDRELPQRPVSSSLMLDEFGQITDKEGLTRRQAIARLSRKYGLSARDVYGMIEDAKKSGV
jgi:16S rRNA (cytidine1402-2'-O)-methyltransferase